ncbi:hypothetical protein KKI17_02530 [Patescibacteria group bacterium]|nr:hypothetical protein [Patescibacteria group bacterium]
MGDEDLIKQADIQRIAEVGSQIYEEVKHEYEPQSRGKFLAIDIESRDVYLGENSSEAVEHARAKHPQKVFYVVKVGSSASEVLAGLQKVEV